jgi:SAM-dependent methyltransferase
MAEKHLIRIADWGVTEETVIFADDFVLERLSARGDVLDIGCGRGRFDAKVAPRVRSVTGIDIMPEEIEAAEKLKQHSNIKFAVFDAEQLANLPGEFDAIFSRYCFHHLHFQKVAEGIKRKLQPGGRLIAVDCLEDYWKLSGSFFILYDAMKRLGVVKFLMLLPRLMFFFTPKRFQHVASDIKRIKQERRYHFEDFRKFYLHFFPGADIGMIGCAGYIDWIKK